MPVAYSMEVQLNSIGILLFKHSRRMRIKYSENKSPIQVRPHIVLKELTESFLSLRKRHWSQFAKPSLNLIIIGIDTGYSSRSEGLIILVAQHQPLFFGEKYASKPS